jgi:hypothetical protein
MDKDKEKQEKLDKRAAALRANLKRRKDVAKAKAEKIKDKKEEGQ